MGLVRGPVSLIKPGPPLVTTRGKGRQGQGTLEASRPFSACLLCLSACLQLSSIYALQPMTAARGRAV